MKNPYKKWTLAQRTNLAQAVAASTFHTFCDSEMRGPNWKPDDVPNIIAMEARIQTVLGAINPKYKDEIVKIAVDFYNRYLATAMDMIK